MFLRGSNLISSSIKVKNFGSNVSVGGAALSDVILPWLTDRHVSMTVLAISSDSAPTTTGSSRNGMKSTKLCSL